MCIACCAWPWLRICLLSLGNKGLYVKLWHVTVYICSVQEGSVRRARGWWLRVVSLGRPAAAFQAKEKEEEQGGREGGREGGGDYKLRQSYATCVLSFLSDLPDSSINNQMVWDALGTRNNHITDWRHLWPPRLLEVMNTTRARLSLQRCSFNIYFPGYENITPFSSGGFNYHHYPYKSLLSSSSWPASR